MTGKPAPPLAGDDPAHDEIAALIQAITGLVTGLPNLIGFDFADLRVALRGQGRAAFGQGEAEGPDRARRAADAALAELKAAAAPVTHAGIIPARCLDGSTVLPYT